MKALTPAILATTINLLGVIGSLFLHGCVTQPQPPDTPPVVKDSKKEVVPTPAARPFPAETLYALLVAEMAGSREQYRIALDNYVQQAHKTRDPSIVARATRIARFLSAHKAALTTALLWVEIAPQNSEARLIAATTLAQNGRLQEAFAHSRYLLEQGSTPVFQNIAARAVGATDTQREQLLSEYQQLIKSYPKNLPLIVGKGLLLQQQNDLKGALKIARKALAVDEAYIPAAILEAKLLYQMKKPEKALQRLAVLLQKYPNNKRLRLQYARMLATFDLELAHEQFKLLIKQSPNDPDLIFSVALVSNERGLKEEARQHFENLVRLGRRVSSAHYYLGRIAEENQDLAQALEHYMQVEPGSDFLPALLNYTHILVRLNDVATAHQRLSALRQRFPSQSERFFLLESEVLSHHQLLEEAERVLTEALRLHPSSIQLLYSRAMVNERRNFIELTEHDLRAILKYEPNNATALNALGYTLADRTTRYEEALELISKALNIKPDDPAFIDSMGWVQYRLGNLEEAILRLSEAMKAFPDDEIAAHLGEVLWSVGNEKEARDVWKEGLRLNPESKTIPAVIERMEKNTKSDRAHEH